MTTSEVWILIAAIAAVLLVALVAGYALNKRRRVSLTAPVTETKEVTDRSGGYQASSGFSFSQGGAKPAPEPVRVERTDDEGQPHVGDDAAIPRDAPKRAIHDVRLPDPVQGPELAPEVDSEVVTPENEPAAAEATEAAVEPDESGTAAETSVVEESATEVQASDAAEEEAAEAAVAAAEIAAAAEAAVAARTAAPETTAPETAAPAGVSEAAIAEIEPTSGRLERLRGRLSRSQNAVGKSLLGLLGGGDLDEDSWEEIEDTLVMADLGTAVTATIVERLRQEMATRSVRTAADARAVLREVLVEALRPELDRSIRALPHADHPSILLVVGVNGTGKTTTTGKLARVLVADGRRVLLGAADTFRAAAADQLQTWGERVGADTVRGKEGRTPPPSRSTRSRPVSSAAWTWCSSTPRAACTPRPV